MCKSVYTAGWKRKAQPAAYHEGNDDIRKVEGYRVCYRKEFQDTTAARGVWNRGR
ncbi:MAG: hypothetical protein HFH26_12690 [Clostridiaceae bacterium]|nr:hypothetical protein [Clostridiaceae bacterium]